MIFAGLTMGVVWFSITFYLYRRLARPFVERPRTVWAARGIAALVWVIVPVTFLSRLARHLPGQAEFAVFGYVVMGTVGALATFVLLRDGLLLGDAGLRRIRRKEPLDPSRREFLLRSSSAGIAVGTAGIAGTGLIQAMNPPVVERVPVPIEGLHPDLEGMTIAQISDLHVGATSRADDMQKIAEQVNALKPDLIAVTGDLVDGSVPQLSKDLEPLFGLKAPMGVFFCTGNHEYYAGWKPWCDHLAAGGWEVLLDEHRVVKKGGATVTVAGVTDLRATRMEPNHPCDPAKACAGAPESQLKLLLAHQPRTIARVEPGSYDLMLSGHTHGGQFFPFTLIVHLAQPLVAGLYRQKDTWVYVNRGTTHWGPPIRLGSAQEITLLELRKA